MKRKKQTIMAVTACAVAGVMGITGMLAYMTDNETHTNTFSVDGKSKIDLVETAWNDEDSNGDGVPDVAERLVPNAELTKNPKVLNSGDADSTGGKDVIAFLRVTVPVRDVTRVQDDGQIQILNYNQAIAGATETAEPKPGAETDIKIWNEERDAAAKTPLAHSSQEIFYFKYNNNKADDSMYGPTGTVQNENADYNKHENYFNPNWINLPTEESITLQDIDVTIGHTGDGYETSSTETPAEVNIMGTTASDVSQGTKRWVGSGWKIGQTGNGASQQLTGTGQRVYVFGWHERLKPGDYTESLFDKVQLKNIIENELAENDIQNIKIEAFSIQADNVYGSYYTGTTYNRDNPSYQDPVYIDTSSLDVRKLTAIYDTYIRQNGHVVTAADHAAGKYTDKSVGDMVYDFFQDSEHGTTEKEADINNLKDLHDKGIGQSITAWTQTQEGEKTNVMYIHPKEGEGSSARRYLYIKWKANEKGEQPTSVTFTSSDPSVATVDATTGQIKAISIGDTTIVATTNSGVQVAVHVSVQSDARYVQGKDYSNSDTASSRPEGTSQDLSAPTTPQP